MYKIKDDVDLEILEKEFGFIHIDNNYMLVPRYKRGRIKIYYDCWRNLSIYYAGRTEEEVNASRVANGVVPLIERGITIRYEDEVLLQEDSDNDILDLIKAGLTEVV